MSKAARSNDISSIPEASTTPKYVTRSAIFKQWSMLKDGEEIVAYSKTFMKPDHELQFIKHITITQKANKKVNEKRKAERQQAKGLIKSSPLVIDKNYARSMPTFRKWMKLGNGRHLIYHTKPYTKIANDDTNEKRLIQNH